MVTMSHYGFRDDTDFFPSLSLFFLVFFLLHFILLYFGKRLQEQREDINGQGNEYDGGP